MQCLKCLQNGHPVSHLTKTVTNTNSNKQSDKGKFKLSKLSNPQKK